MIDIENMPEDIKRLKQLLPLVTVDASALREAGAAIIYLQLDQMSREDLAEYFFETKMVDYQKDPTNLQCDMEYFIDVFDEPDIDTDDVIVPFKD